MKTQSWNITHLHIKEDWKLKKKRKKIDSFSLNEVLSKLYFLDVSTEGHRQYLYTTPAFSVNPPTPSPLWDPVMFPPRGPAVDGVWARRKWDRANKFWRMETWLDVTYLLSKPERVEWGRTGRVHFLWGTQAPPLHLFRLQNSCTTADPVLHHLPPCSPSPTHQYVLNQCR